METNPGPDSQDDPTLARIDEPFDDSIGCVLWEAQAAEAQKQNRISFNAVLANRHFKKELAKRLLNALYHCNCDRYWGEAMALPCYQSAIKVFAPPATLAVRGRGQDLA